MRWPERKNDILQGTLVLLVLRTLRDPGMHGYAITAHIQRVSADLLRVEEGSLYPALHRMEQEGWLASAMGHHREEPPGPLLLADRGRAAAARAGAGELGPRSPTAWGGSSERLTAPGAREEPWPGIIGCSTCRAAGRLARDIDREMAFHLAERVDELMAPGWAKRRPGARPAAASATGGPAGADPRRRTSWSGSSRCSPTCGTPPAGCAATRHSPWSRSSRWPSASAPTPRSSA